MATNIRPHALRSDQVFAALDRAAADGTTLVFEGETSDYFVIGGSFTRLPHLIALWSAKRGIPTLTYSMAEGTKHLVAPSGPRPTIKEATPDLGEGPAVEVTGLLKGIVGGKQPTTLVLDYVEAMLPSQTDGAGRSIGESILMEEVLSQALDPRLGWVEGGHRLVLISRTGDLQSCITEMPGVVRHSLGLPDGTEREAAISLMLDSSLHRLVLERDLEPATLARLSGGMSLDALSRVRYATSDTKPLTRSLIIREKAATIRKMAGSTLTVYDEERTMDDVAGLPQVRLYVEDTLRTGRSTIRVLLAGPPGNGKTLVSLAIARLLGVPAVALNQIKDMWVGNSEKALAKALEVIKSMAPVLVIADEFDQTMGGSRAASSAMESSAVESSLRAMFMEFTGDNAADDGISFIGMSNNPQGIDAAFISRFQTIAVLEPASALERVDVMMKNTKKVGASVDQAGLEQAFRETLRSFSCRDLVDLLVAANVHAAINGTTTVGRTEIAAAIRESQQYSTSRQERQALAAVAFTFSSRYLPWNASKTMGDSAATPPSYLQTYVYADGTLDQDALRAELERAPGVF